MGTGESAKAYQRAERKCKELVFSSGEDKKNQDRMSDLAAKLQSKIKTYKQQIEEAEEIAPQSGQVQKGSAGAGRGRGESQACFPHLNNKHLSGQLKLEENLSVVNRNIIQLLPQSENTEVATR